MPVLRGVTTVATGLSALMGTEDPVTTRGAAIQTRLLPLERAGLPVLAGARPVPRGCFAVGSTADVVTAAVPGAAAVGDRTFALLGPPVPRLRGDVAITSVLVPRCGGDVPDLRPLVPC